MNSLSCWILCTPSLDLIRVFLLNSWTQYILSCSLCWPGVFIICPLWISMGGYWPCYLYFIQQLLPVYRVLHLCSRYQHFWYPIKTLRWQASTFKILGSWNPALHSFGLNQSIFALIQKCHNIFGTVTLFSFRLPMIESTRQRLSNDIWVQ